MEQTNKELAMLKESLYETLVGDGTFDELVKKSSLYMQAPVIVIDQTYRILSHYSETEITDIFWSNHVKQKFCNINFIVQFNRLPSVIAGNHQNDPFVVPCPHSTYPKLVCKLQMGGNVYGSVICLCQHEPEEGDLAAIKIIAGVLSFKWKASLHSDLEQFRENILINLLAGSYQDDVDTRERLHFSNITFPKRMYIMAIDTAPESPYSDTLVDCLDYSNSLFHQELFVYYQGHIVIFLEEEHLPMFADLMTQHIQDTGIHVGVSRLVQDLAKCPQAFQEALDALDLGQCARPDNCIHYYQELVYYSLLKNIDPRQGIEEYRHPVLKTLEEYDRKNCSELYGTLFHFLNYDGSLQKTAQMMYMHRNTVSFRVNKIAELVNVDLHDPELRKQLLVSYRIVEFFAQKMERASGKSGEERAQETFHAPIRLPSYTQEAESLPV